MTAAVDLARYRERRESVDVEQLVRRLDDLKGRRYTFDSHWSEMEDACNYLLAIWFLSRRLLQQPTLDIWRILRCYPYHLAMVDHH